MRNLREAVEYLRPNSQFTAYDAEDYSKLEWDKKKNNDQELPTKAECEAAQTQADTLKQAKQKSYAAVKVIESKKDKALRMMLKFVATLPDCPEPLQTMAADIATAESDLQGDD